MSLWSIAGLVATGALSVGAVAVVGLAAPAREHGCVTPTVTVTVSAGVAVATATPQVAGSCATGSDGN